MKKIAILSIFILAFLAVNISFAAQQPQMSVNVTDIEEGSTAHVAITLPSDATGKVTVSLNGQNYTATVQAGQASVDVFGLKAGDYGVKVTYDGAGNYSKVVKQANLKVATQAKSNDTSVDTNTSTRTNTSANVSGEPAGKVNTTVLKNLTNNTNSSNSTNDTNKSNITPKKTTTNNTVAAKKPKQPPKKPLAKLSNKNTGLPVLILMLVTVGAIFATAFRKR
ncbi:Ig-like domain-containing protein [uncultured Methanobrevibacter sp.]|uniref:Ig-like domain-containing protein n=1 Tax=uncultured Methanobrevibacter sp. TaxID=253161 RepID=UPI0025DFE584|nr:Ig-like domain-containing protein [uncultured Methanobrevibacter sp.]